MALKLSYDTADGSPVWTDAYHRIEGFRSLQGGKAWIVVATYFNEANKGKPMRIQRDYEFPYAKNGTNVHAQGYSYLVASEPDFQGAENV